MNTVHSADCSVFVPTVGFEPLADTWIILYRNHEPGRTVGVCCKNERCNKVRWIPTTMEVLGQVGCSVLNRQARVYSVCVAQSKLLYTF